MSIATDVIFKQINTKSEIKIFGEKSIATMF